MKKLACSSGRYSRCVLFWYQGACCLLAGPCKPLRSLTHLVANCDHDAVFSAIIRHASMPGSKISDHDIAFGALGLNRRSDWLPLFRHGWLHVAGWIARHLTSHLRLLCTRYLVLARCMSMRSKPEFCSRKLLASSPAYQQTRRHNTHIR